MRERETGRDVPEPHRHFCIRGGGRASDSAQGSRRVQSRTASWRVRTRNRGGTIGIGTQRAPHRPALDCAQGRPNRDSVMDHPDEQQKMTVCQTTRPPRHIETRACAAATTKQARRASTQIVEAIGDLDLLRVGLRPHFLRGRAPRLVRVAATLSLDGCGLSAAHSLCAARPRPPCLPPLLRRGGRGRRHACVRALGRRHGAPRRRPPPSQPTSKAPAAPAGGGSVGRRRPLARGRRRGMR